MNDLLLPAILLSPYRETVIRCIYRKNQIMKNVYRTWIRARICTEFLFIVCLYIRIESQEGFDLI
jgi:hypothetical protein